MRQRPRRIEMCSSLLKLVLAMVAPVELASRFAVDFRARALHCAVYNQTPLEKLTETPYVQHPGQHRRTPRRDAQCRARIPRISDPRQDRYRRHQAAAE